jgi:hypothetical protein
VFLIFSATAFMSQQTPPHDVAQRLLLGEPASPMFLRFFEGVFSPDMSLTLEFNALSLALAVLSILFLISIIFSFIIKRLPSYLSILFSLLFMITSYFAIMLAIGN